jgi:hypothetical protein
MWCVRTPLATGGKRCRTDLGVAASGWLPPFVERLAIDGYQH